MDRRTERKNSRMPLVKIDLSHPQTFFDVLKQMNIKEGTEIEIEEQKEGVFLRRTNVIEKRPFTGQEIVDHLEQKFTKIRGDIPEDSTDLDSNWWSETIQEGKVIKDSEVELE